MCLPADVRRHEYWPGSRHHHYSLHGWGRGTAHEVVSDRAAAVGVVGGGNTATAAARGMVAQDDDEGNMGLKGDGHSVGCPWDARTD